MSSEVEEHRLESICLLVVDCPHATPKWTDSGVVVLRNQNIKAGRLDLSTPSFTDEAHYKGRTKRAVPTPGDIVITREAPMGDVCLIPEGLRCCLGQRQVLLRLDPSKVDARFLLFALQSPYVQFQIGWNQGTGSTVSNLRIPVLESLKIPTPPMSLQVEIATTLGALDDRITLLRETNATLEAIAQALFKSWFVDFDPVRAKLEGLTPEGMDEATAALFPDGLEESELGLVPRGWRVAQCQDLFEVRDGTHESPKPSLDGYPLVTSKHITSGRVNFQDTYLISEGDYTAISKRSKVNRLDVLITMIGTVGLSAILLDDRNDFAIKNIGLFKTSAAPNFAYFFSLLLKSARMQEYLSARLAGTTQKYLSLKALREIGLLVPTEKVLVEFSKIASTLFDVIHRNSQQAQTLATLRDTLLPRLISGALRLPEVS